MTDEDTDITRETTRGFQCPHCRLIISTHTYADHIRLCRQKYGKNSVHVLDIELGYFKQHRKEWFKHHAGKFALIKGATIHDFYDTADYAYEIGVELWGMVPFLIKEVQLEDAVVDAPGDRFVIRVMEKDQEGIDD